MGNSVPAFGHLVKRDAEAEAEADPLYIDTSITGTGGIGTVYPTSVYPTLRSFPVVPTVNSVPTNVVPTVNSVPTVCLGVDCVRRNIHTVNRVVPTVNTVIPTWMSPVARSPMPGMDMADTMKTETDAGDVVVA